MEGSRPADPALGAWCYTPGWKQKEASSSGQIQLTQSERRAPLSRLFTPPVWGPGRCQRPISMRDHGLRDHLRLLSSHSSLGPLGSSAHFQMSSCDCAVPVQACVWGQVMAGQIKEACLPYPLMIITTLMEEKGSLFSRFRHLWHWLFPVVLLFLPLQWDCLMTRV